MNDFHTIFGDLIHTAAERGPVLTPAQVGRLQGLVANDQDARVVWWSQLHEGPVVQLSNFTRVAIRPTGRKVPLPTCRATD